MPSADEPRETSGATTSLVVSYVREHGGEAAVRELLRRSGVRATVAQLEDQARWSGYASRIALFEAATDVLGDPATSYQIGATSLTHGLNPSVVLLVRALGSPRQVFRQLPRAIPKFSTTSTMEVLDSGAGHATIRYRLHDGYVHSRLDCDYARGLFSVVPGVFGLPPAHVVHDECESDGHPACVYHVTWARRSVLPWRRGRAGREDAELVALRSQLQTLQSAAVDLASADSLEAVLERITDRAAAAVLAPAYLLAVHRPGGGPPLVHACGLAEGRAEELADRLLSGEELGPQAVVVDVASPRRRHGRLAALYDDGARGMAAERSMLDAYAGHAAAALDLLVALADARAEAGRAQALLALAHELAGSTSASAVAHTVAKVLPDVVGCVRSTVFLWHPEHADLRAEAAVGLRADQRELLLRAPLPAEDTPEILQMLEDAQPRQLSVESASPRLARLLTGLGLEGTTVVPLRSGTTFLGVLAAGWEGPVTPGPLPTDRLARMQGVADQAATALQGARLLDAVRHQALHDALTGVPNRLLLADRLEQELAAAGRHDGVAVLFCDLDRFKRVNDERGHAAGDELLRQVAARLLAAVRPGDTVARLSGDEFAVLLPGISAPDLARTLADRIVSSFRDPFRLDGHEVLMTTSVGVALHVGPGGGVDDLLRAADGAMYGAKGSGRNQVAVADGSRPRDGGSAGAGRPSRHERDVDREPVRA